MAATPNAISIALVASVRNGAMQWNFPPVNLSLTQNNVGRGGKAQILTTTPAIVDFGDVVTPGFVFLKNLDALNTISYGPKKSDGTPQLDRTLLPGEPAMFRQLPGAILMAQSAAGGTGTALLDVTVLEG